MSSILEKITLNKLLTTAGIVSFIGTGIYIAADRNTNQNLTAALPTPIELGNLPIVQPTLKYGFALDTFNVKENIIKSGQVFADILLAHKVDYPTIEKLVENTKSVFNVNKLVAGSNYTILHKDSTQTADYFIYEPNVYEYVVFDLKDKLSATLVKRPVLTEVRASAGIIKSSLWDAMVGNGMSFELAAKMEDALQWSIDFHHVQTNDQFKLIYNQDYIEEKPVAIGDLHAAYFKSGTNEYHAIYYKSADSDIEGYYDLKGQPMKKGFLKAPLKYSRISSRYNLKRFHPVLKRTKAHLGTDYAAPYGTEIFAVGDGVVEIAGHTGGNGNYVKIKHDETYQTQYLHMQKFAKGIRSGVHVKQGQVIGYVGSTGLATGPHVCFRFWMNGKQVNHLAIKFPPAKPLPATEMVKFEKIRDLYLEQFRSMDSTSSLVVTEKVNP
jgi:murein DD-endopeptidase MepM/ murein hydrolase activator NlpD